MKRIPRTPEQQEAVADHLYDAINRGSDLVCAIVAAASVEWAGLCLAKKCLIESSVTDRMFDRGALGSVAGVFDFLYCTGKITKSVYQTCIAIGEIRNDFAHADIPLDFNSDAIEAKCMGMKLSDAKPDVIIGLAIKIGGNAKSKRSRKPHAVTARDRYSSFAAQIRIHLLQLAGGAAPIPTPKERPFVELLE